MIYNVAGLLQEPVGAVRRHEVAEDLGRIDAELVTAAPVRGQVKLTHINAGVLAQADLRVVVRVTCGRCLKEFLAPLEVRFSEEYHPVIDIVTGLPLPDPQDRSVFMVDERHVLDLNEAVRQYSLLALPIAPVCDVTCAGLCQECGGDLNDGPCKCPPVPPDERWRALAEFLQGAESGPAAAGSNAELKKKRKH